MSLKVCEFTSIVLSALVAGMFLGPWVALTRSIGSFELELLLTLVRRLNRNMAPVMTVLMPAALLSQLTVLFVSYGDRPRTFYLASAAFVLYLIALFVTAVVEVPIVKRIVIWTVSTRPEDWEQVRDRWGVFHLIRIVSSLAGFILLVAGSIF